MDAELLNASYDLKDWDRLRRVKPMPVEVVWPDGRVTEHVIGDPDIQDPRHPHSPQAWAHAAGGQVPVKIDEGVFTIRGWARKIGCRLMADVCREDGQPEILDRRKQVIKLRRAGKHISAPDEALYPNTVLALREKFRAIGDATGMESFEVLDEDWRKKVASKLAGIGIEIKDEKGEVIEPEPEPEPKELPPIEVSEESPAADDWRDMFPDGEPTMEWSAKEMRAYAAAHDIEISKGNLTKSEILEQLHEGA